LSFKGAGAVAPAASIWPHTASNSSQEDYPEATGARRFLPEILGMG
jgi:hypothetical protein